MTPVEMAEKMLAYIQKYDHVTFVELTRQIGGESKGDYTYEAAMFPNVVLWIGMSKPFVEALGIVIKRSAVKPTVVLTYILDGAALKLPLVKGGSLATVRRYKKPHWLPVVFTRDLPTSETIQ